MTCYPPPLRKGDLIALIAPSTPLGPDRPVEEIARQVEALGFRARIGDSCRRETACGYAAAPASVRAGDINAAFADPAVKAVWCVRGGSTAWQLPPLLNYGAISRDPKPFIGFSDVTTLHLAIGERCGLATYHGPMAGSLLEPDVKFDTFTQKSFFQTLGEWDCLSAENPAGEPVEVLRPGRAAGRLVGGNLSLAAASLGTPWQVDARGAVLFLEDVGEEVYALDRMLSQLRYAGVFASAAAVVLGTFTGCENQYRAAYGPRELMADFFRDCSKPVLYGVKSGHCTPMLTLPLGAVCHLDGERLWFTRK